MLGGKTQLLTMILYLLLKVSFNVYSHPQASLIYFMGEKFYRQSIHTAEYYLKMYSKDPVLLFFKGFGILMEGTTVYLDSFVY